MQLRSSTPEGPRREGGSPTRAALLTSLVSGFRQRCPQCQRGHLFRNWYTFQLNDRCPVCNLRFDRGNGYYIGATALNLLIAEFVATAFWLPLAVDQTVPLWIAYTVGVGASIGLPVLGWRPARSFWLAIDRYLNPVT